MKRLTSGRVEEVFSSVENLQVLVIGDIMLDRYVSGRVERISPEAPVPVVRVESETLAVGGAANVAANVVALGARCELVGCVGDDIHGRVLLEELKGLGIGVGGMVTLSDRPTTVKTRVRARNQQIVRFDVEDDRDITEHVAEELSHKVQEFSEGCGMIALEDYNKGVLTDSTIAMAFRRSEELGAGTVVDPKRARFFAYRGSTIFKPNAKELEESLQESLRPDDASWMEETRVRLGCENLLLTLGGSGMSLSTAGGEHLRVPALARSVYDVSGAGDTVTACTAVALGVGASPVEAAILANHAAALEVQKAGVATVSPEEIVAWCGRFQAGLD